MVVFDMAVMVEFYMAIAVVEQMKMLTVEQVAADDAKLKVEEMLSQHLHRKAILMKMEKEKCVVLGDYSRNQKFVVVVEDKLMLLVRKTEVKLMIELKKLVVGMSM